MTNDERTQPSHSYVSVFVIVCIRVVQAVSVFMVVWVGK